MSGFYNNLVYFTVSKISLKKNGRGEFKKHYYPPKKWEEITANNYKEYIKKNHTGYCILLGKINDLFVIDFDSVEQYDKYSNKYNILKECLRVKTRKGYHCYFKYRDGLTNNNRKMNLKNIDIDLLTNGCHLFGPNTKVEEEICYKIDNEGKINLDCPQELIDDIIKESLNKNEIKEKKVKKIEKKKNENKTGNITQTIENITNNNEVNIDLVKELLDIINPEYRDSYNDWIKIIWSISEYQEYYNIGLEFSKTSPLFQDEDYYKKIWDSRNGKITIGTLHYYANKSDEEEYLSIRSKYYKNNWFGLEDYDLSSVYIELYGYNWIVSNKKLYKFNNIYWKEIKDKNILIKYIRNDLLNFYNRVRIELGKNNKIFLNNTKDNDDNKNPFDEKIEKCCKIINELKKQFKIINISNSFITDITSEEEIKWNTKKYLLAFENGVYNLKDGYLIKKGEQNDYMSLSTGYNYEEETYDNIISIKNLISKIFPKEDERIAYMTILATGLIGQVQENFIIANGKGGNGKGVLNELFLKSIGDYGTKAPNNIILEKIGKGNNPEICLLEDKRFAVMQEPDEEDKNKDIKINQSTIKELTGGSNLKVKDLFQGSKDMDKNIYTTLILECNKRPLLSGTIDDSSSRRLIDIMFRSTFTYDKELLKQTEEKRKKLKKCKNEEKIIELENECYVYDADIYYKSPEFQEKYKNTLMQIVLKEYLPNFIENKENLYDFIPNSIKERTNQYLKDSDIWYSWFIENYKYIEPPKDKNKREYIQIKDIYDKFKYSEFYKNMSKEQKNKLSKNHFTEKIENNKFLKKYYKTKYQPKIYNKVSNKYEQTCIRNCILNYKEINYKEINYKEINYKEINYKEI
jgi:hypothetical protein